MYTGHLHRYSLLVQTSFCRIIYYYYYYCFFKFADKNTLHFELLGTVILYPISCFYFLRVYCCCIPCPSPICSSTLLYFFPPSSHLLTLTPSTIIPIHLLHSAFPPFIHFLIFIPPFSSCILIIHLLLSPPPLPPRGVSVGTLLHTNKKPEWLHKVLL